VGLADVCFLFDDQRAPPGARASLLFEGLVRQITALSGGDVASALAEVDAERARGRHVCGYIAYEAGAYVLFGAVGVQLTASPTPSAAPIATIATLRLRYF